MVKRLVVLITLGAVFAGCYFRRPSSEDGRYHSDGGAYKESTYSHEEQRRDREDDERRDEESRRGGLFFWR